MTASAADVTAALERLGDTRDEVAATLLAEGHSGCVWDVASRRAGPCRGVERQAHRHTFCRGS